MALPVYPSNQLDDTEFLTSLLGSFWSAAFYGGQEQAVAIVGATAQLEQQVSSDIQDLVNAGGRQTVPVYRRVRWVPVTLLASQTIPADLPTYGSDITYGMPGLIYGDSLDGAVAFAAPSQVAAVQVICTTPGNPTRAWTRLIDFYLDTINHYLVFWENPFTDPRVPQVPVLDSHGNVIDQSITLWLFMADTEANYIANTYGYVLNYVQPSSPGYKVALNTLWDALVSGTAREQLETLLEVTTDAYLAGTTGETVQVITTDAQGQLVITDQTVYRYPVGATILVDVGDVLTAGQPIANTFIIYDLNRGQVPSTWPALTLGQGFLIPAITDELTFQNLTLPTTYTADDGFGYAELQFPVSGLTADVTTFWNAFQSRGRAINQTLAMSLDTRTHKVGQPGPTNLPATINPMAFVIQQVLRYNTLLVTINSAQFGPNAFDLPLLAQFLRTILPPWMTVLFLILLTGPADSITLTLTDDTGSNFDATEPQTDAVDSDDTSDVFGSVFYV